jgi:hypothetical protein
VLVQKIIDSLLNKEVSYQTEETSEVGQNKNHKLGAQLLIAIQQDFKGQPIHLLKRREAQMP